MTTQHESDVPPIDDWNRLLDGRVAVVTGGGAGIGARHRPPVRASTARRSRSPRSTPSAAGDTVADIEAAGGVARAHVVDVTDRGRRGVASPTPSSARTARRRAGEQRRRLPAAGAVLAIVAGVVAAMYDDQPAPRVRRDARLPRPDDRARRRLDRQRALGRGHARLSRRAGLRRDEGGGRRASPPTSPSTWAATASGSTASAPTSPRPRRSTTSPDTRRPRTSGRRGRRSGGWAGRRTRRGWRCSSPPTSARSSPATTSRSTAAPWPAGGWFYSPTEGRFVNRPRTL